MRFGSIQDSVEAVSLCSFTLVFSALVGDCECGRFRLRLGAIGDLSLPISLSAVLYIFSSDVELGRDLVFFGRSGHCMLRDLSVFWFGAASKGWCCENWVLKSVRSRDF